MYMLLMIYVLGERFVSKSVLKVQREIEKKSVLKVQREMEMCINV